MKRIILIIGLFLFTNCLISQSLLSVSLNFNESGRNICFDYGRLINNKHEIGVGLRININRITQQDDQNNIYYRRLYATELYQYFGLHGFYHRMIFEKWTCFRPYAFYDFQITKSTTRTSMYVPYAITNDGELLYKLVVENFGPFIWLDQNIGLGFKVSVSKSIEIFQKFGVGCSLLMGDEEMLPDKSTYFQYELGYLITFGASIKIPNL